jgi:hypothetical protein
LAPWKQFLQKEEEEEATMPAEEYTGMGRSATSRL